MLATCAAFQAGRERINRISTGIDRGRRVQSDQAAVAVGIGGDVVIMLTAIGVAGKLLAPVFQPAHRMAEVPGQISRTHLFRQQHSFVAEAATNIRRNDSDVFLRQTEASREAGANDVRNLGGGIQNDLIEPLVIDRDHTAPFEWRHALSSRSQRSSDHDGRVFFDLAQIGFDAAFEENIVAPMFVYQRCIGRARCQHVDDSGQFLKIDLHRSREIFGFCPRRSHTDRDRFADVAYLVMRQDRLGRRLETSQTGIRDNRLDADEIGSHEHAAFLSRRLADIQNSSVGQRTAHVREFTHAGELDVADELAPAAHVAVVFFAAD